MYGKIERFPGRTFFINPHEFESFWRKYNFQYLWCRSTGYATQNNQIIGQLLRWCWASFLFHSIYPYNVIVAKFHQIWYGSEAIRSKSLIGRHSTLHHISQQNTQIYRHLMWIELEYRHINVFFLILILILIDAVHFSSLLAPIGFTIG